MEQFRKFSEIAWAAKRKKAARAIEHAGHMLYENGDIPRRIPEVVIITKEEYDTLRVSTSVQVDRSEASSKTIGQRANEASGRMFDDRDTLWEYSMSDATQGFYNGLTSIEKNKFSRIKHALMARYGPDITIGEIRTFTDEELRGKNIPASWITIIREIFQKPPEIEE